MPPPDPRSDQELVAALNGGDASAFDALYFRYRDRVLRLAFRFTGNDADAQDVLQETFAYVYRKVPRLHLSGALTTLLFPVVRNLSLAARRKRRRMQGESVEAMDELPGFAAAAGPDQSRAELAAAMANLSPAHREAILLRFVDDLSVEEIAAATGAPAGTVKSRLHHAIAALRADPRARRYFQP